MCVYITDNENDSSFILMFQIRVEVETSIPFEFYIFITLPVNRLAIYKSNINHLNGLLMNQELFTL